MLKEIETEEKIVFFMTFLSLVAFQLRGGGGGGGAGPLSPATPIDMPCFKSSEQVSFDQ